MNDQDRERERREMFWINCGIPIVFGGGFIAIIVALVWRLS